MILALSLGESVVNHFARRCCGKFCLGLVLKRQEGGRRGTYHLALPRQEDEIAMATSVWDPSDCRMEIERLT